MIHEAAARGFERGVAEYERGRPGYPAALARYLGDELGVGPGVHAVDVGSGTGKFVRVLVETGADVVAVEPVAGMRVALKAAFPGVPVLHGTAERLPLRSASVDAVTAAQAFHWFEADSALAEAHRVLRPGGVLVLVWNKRDDQVDWVRDLEQLHADLAGDAPRYTRDAVRWAETIGSHAGFGQVTHAVFDNAVVADVETFRARESSISYISALSDERRALVLEEVEAIVRRGPLAGGGETFVEPYVTDVFWCRRT